MLTKERGYKIMRTYKKGISLIVLVVTVIVLAILATTVIISLSNTNIIGQASDAVNKNNLAAYREQASLAYASWKMENKSDTLTDLADLKEHGFDVDQLPDNYCTDIRNGVPVVNTASVWDGTYPTITATTENILSGTGTEADPYIISNASEFAFLSAYAAAGRTLQGKYVKLTTNIDLAGHAWTPIGTVQHAAFVINFDGDFHTIYNINVSSENVAGVFGFIDDPSSINNLSVSGGSVSGLYAGAIIGHGSIIVDDRATFSNLNNYGVRVRGTSYAGGIAGYCSWTILKNCENTGTVISDEGKAGGIIGYGYIMGTVENSVNRGDVTGKIATGIQSVIYACEQHVKDNTNYGNVHGTEEAAAIVYVEDSAAYEEWTPNYSVTNYNYGTITVDAGGTVNYNGVKNN